MSLSRALLPRARALPHRPLLLALLTLAMYRHRHPFLTRLRAFFRALSRAVHAVNLLSLVLSQTSSDVQHYLHPAPARRRLPASAPQAPVPRSLRRLLKLAASPDALSVLHRLAGGVAQGVTRQLQTSPPSTHAPARDCAPPAQQPAAHRLHELIVALAAPAGQAVVRNVVSTAVREGVHAVVEANERRRDPCDRPWPEVVVAGLTSDKGRQLVVDVATNVARTVVPAFVQAQAAQTHAQASAQGDLTSVAALSPMASPLRKKRPPSCGSARNSLSPATESPITKHLVMSVMQAQGSAGVVERLALLAIRDKALVREVVRTVVSEAVRTYLTTQAKLREEGITGDATRAAESSAVSLDVAKDKEIRKAAPSPEAEDVLEQRAGNSLWKLLIKSAVVDLKQALLDRASRQGNAGWLIF